MNNLVAKLEKGIAEVLCSIEIAKEHCMVVLRDRNLEQQLGGGESYDLGMTSWIRASQIR